MHQVTFRCAYYVKLGRGGKWERQSIGEGKIRIGWAGQAVADINSGNWELIRGQIQSEMSDKSAATRDLKALRMIVESTEEDLWITFHASRLWWCRVGEPGIHEDAVSKYRKLKGPWNDRDVEGNLLLIDQIPGQLAKIQGFRATICRVKDVDALRRLINNSPSDVLRSIGEARSVLVKTVVQALHELHWKDFETLVDLVFRASGWRRTTLLGETMKYSDLVLEDPITGDIYLVQIKSRADFSDFVAYAAQFPDRGYRRLYFVVHTPLGHWEPAAKLARTEIILPDRLAQMVIDHGLLNWLTKKVR